jgi:hypothetical protein
VDALDPEAESRLQSGHRTNEVDGVHSLAPEAGPSSYCRSGYRNKRPSLRVPTVGLWRTTLGATEPLQES